MDTWKIWYETYNEKGDLIGAGVMTTEYRTKKYAEKQAAKFLSNKPLTKYVVSQTNPW